MHKRRPRGWGFLALLLLLLGAPPVRAARPLPRSRPVEAAQRAFREMAPPHAPSVEVCKRGCKKVSFNYAPGEGLPMTRKMGEYLKKRYKSDRPLAGTVLFFAGHYMREALPMMEVVRDLGMPPENLFSVSVAYSAKRYVFGAMKDRPGLTPPRYPRSPKNMERLVRARFREAVIYHITHPGTKLVALEDGGYVAVTMKSVLEELNADAKYGPLLRENLDLRSSTEQTAAGGRRYEEHRPDQLELPNGQKGFGVFGVDRSWLKAAVEAPEVAQMVADGLNRHLRWKGFSLTGANVVSIGYGHVGRYMAAALLGRGAAHVTVVDKSEQARDTANVELASLTEGFFPARSLKVEPDPRPSIESLRAAHIVVGVTGFRTIDKWVIDHVSTGTYLVSGSSKTNEIDLEYLESLTARKTVIEKFGVVHYLHDGRKLIVLANGEPVNFWKQHISLPSSTIDPVLAEMVWAITRSAAGPRPRPGIRGIPDGVQKMLARWMQNEPGMWSALGSSDATPAAAAAAAKTKQKKK
jgi:S-adenosylhomocysteine hydrolase